VVNIGEMIPLHSLPGLKFFYLGFPLGPWQMFCFSFWVYHQLLSSTFVPVWHRGVPFMFELPWILVRSRV